jgi:excisionase family DNA binding protein
VDATKKTAAAKSSSGGKTSLEVVLPLAYRPLGVARAAAVSLREAQRWISSGRLRSFRVGRSRFVRVSTLEKFLAELEAASEEEKS